MAETIDRLRAALTGRYEIQKEIGAGGMATVYIAHDIKHDRDVAIKVLHPDLGAALGSERFLSEIKTTAKLQHPHILPLLDSGEADGLLYYVMPVVSGESLRARMEREGQLSINESVRIAKETASALDYAHRHGVIHRDIKPENILLHDGQAIVADFGIALAVSAAGGSRMTQTGLSLGTPQYMSPEQAMGERAVDSRSDIYSLGAVTYEMLTGDPPFTGSNVQAIVSKIMTQRPTPISAVRDTVPETVENAVTIALAKLPADRFATAGDFASALDGGGSTHHSTYAKPVARSRRVSRSLGIALSVTSLLAATFGFLWARAPRPDTRLLQFVVDLPADQRLMIANESAVALSPDGGMLAYIAREKTRGSWGIHIRPLDSLRPREETISGMAPLFSSDGQWLFLRAANDIRKVPVNGGNPEVITKVRAWQGYAVSPAGTVVFSSDDTLWRAGDKGKRVPIITADSASGEQSYASPTFLDENTLAFWIQRSDGDPGRGVGITTLKGGEHSVLNIPGDKVFGVLDGHLLMGDGKGSLLAYPVNLRRRAITGPPVVLLDSVVWTFVGGLQLSIANDGTLAYLRGRSGRSLAIVDRTGKLIAETPEAGEWLQAALSPDGRRVAFTVLRSTVGAANIATSDVWIWDVDGGSIARFTQDGGSSPAWTADGKRFAYLGQTSTTRNAVMWAPVDGSAPAEVLFRVPETFGTPWNFSFARGGREMLLDISRKNGTNDIYSVNLGASERKLVPLVATEFSETQGAASPDGRWLAYVSNETGRPEVYVRAYSSAEGRVRVSTNGGYHPQWLRDGKLLYDDGNRGLVMDLVASANGIKAVVRDSIVAAGSRQDVSGTGDRILLTREPPGWRIVVIKNWIADARRRLRER